jgi:hypothetical protein
MAKKNLLNNIIVIICTFVFWFFLITSPLVSMILWEGFKKVLCYMTTLGGYCYYVNPVWDISEKDLLMFIAPTWILFVTFCIYILNILNKSIGKINGKEITKKEKNYFIAFLIIVWLLPALWIFINLVFLWNNF